jgi:hypothetical protein
MRLAVELAVSKGVNLKGAYLTDANLKGAYLTGANLTGANLTDANLKGANLTGANLTGANLTGANLKGANLTGANLTGAYLKGANLTGANLKGAYLTGAYLTGAYLTGAYLTGAYLTGANLTGAYLTGAYLTGAINMPTFQIVPEIGPFYAFKKLKDGIIATLYVPRSAKRVNSTGRKCRVSKVKVVAMTDGHTEALDRHTGRLLYRVGSWVKPDSFNDDIREECTDGIHCFITRKEAEDY